MTKEMREAAVEVAKAVGDNDACGYIVLKIKHGVIDIGDCLNCELEGAEARLQEVWDAVTGAVRGLPDHIALIDMDGKRAQS